MPSTAMRRALFAVAALLLMVPAVHAQTIPADVAAARKLEGTRTAAMVNADVATLDRLLADDLTYFHSSGLVDTKASMIALLKSGDLKYRSFTQSDVKARTYGNVVILTGKAVTVTTRVNQNESTHRINFTSVWAKLGAEWKFVAWQSTEQPAPAK